MPDPVTKLRDKSEADFEIWWAEAGHRCRIDREAVSVIFASGYALGVQAGTELTMDEMKAVLKTIWE